MSHNAILETSSAIARKVAGIITSKNNANNVCGFVQVVVANRANLVIHGSIYSPSILNIAVTALKHARRATPRTAVYAKRQVCKITQDCWRNFARECPVGQTSD